MTTIDVHMNTVSQESTILSQACFPSMKPFGIALGVRISYLAAKGNEDKSRDWRASDFSVKPQLQSVSCRESPLSELLEDDAVGEPLSADADPLQDSIASQLIQDQVRLQFTCLQKPIRLM